MEINYTPKAIQFTSKANPIKAFTIKTKSGPVRVYEPSDNELHSKGLLHSVIDLFCRNFTKDTNDPGWLRFQDPKFSFEFDILRRNFLLDTQARIKRDDGHLTLLVAKDKNNKLCGACLSYGFDCIPSAMKTAMYVDSIAVEKDFRGNGVAKIMLQKSIEAEKNHFTDVFLLGEKLAEGFYRKLGFKQMNSKSKNQNEIIAWMKLERFDFPKYVSLLTKPLQKQNKRWYDIAANEIRKQNQWNY